MATKVISQDALKLYFDISDRYADSLSEMMQTIARDHDGDMVTPDDVIDAATVIAESAPTYITGK